MNNTPIKVGAIYKMREDYDKSFFQYDHAEKFVIVLSEDYSDLHPKIKVYIYHKKGINRNRISMWSIRSFERWEILSEAG